MTSIANLLGAERAQAVSAAAEARQRQTALMAKVQSSEAADQRESGYDIDPRSEALIEVTCEGPDCGAEILVHPPTDAPRILLCGDCAKKAVAELKARGRSVQIIHRPTVVNTIKEKPVYDLDNLSDAELGKIVRERMLLLREQQVIPAVAEAKVKKAKKDKAEAKAHKAEHANRAATKPLTEIVVSSTLTIPALELSEVDLNTAPSGKERSPYNKARYRLKLGELLDPETCTYATLAECHVEIAAAVAAKPVKAKAEPKVEPKVEVPKVRREPIPLASTDPKVTALMVALDVSEKKAKKIMAAIA